ncbi:uncharacterized protein LOC130623152 [Hydractinia symbiolongicarpus]|uniref:uncharacterized protein LOC130623152 n=1 Tax=Hydractinia symbiolongicarpus TaxID=13093 RepID=UPI00254C9CA5|nr:uncharacterized protein LOC130623152 [Hydractinia symbiolongicarpus]
MDIVESSGICNIESCFFTSLNKTGVYFSRRSRWLFVLLLLSGDVEKCPGPNATDEIREFTNAKGMNMFHLNVRGLWANFAEISNILINNRKIDIFSLTEIHTGDEPEDMFAINGYTFIQNSRKFGKGGGVAFYVADHIIYKRRLDLEINEIEGIWLEICPKNAKSYLLPVIYRPPDNSKYLNKDFSSLLSDVLSLKLDGIKEVIILGDLNVDFLKKNDHVGIKTALTLHVTMTLYVVLENNITPVSLAKPINCRNYRNYDKDKFCQTLSSQNFQDVYNSTNVNKAWSLLKGIIYRTYDSMAPLVRKKVRGKPCDWMTVDLKKEMNSRDNLLRKSRKTKSEADITAYKKIRNKVNNKVRKAKNTYQRQLFEENTGNPEPFWRSIKKVFPLRSNSQVNTTIQIDEKLVTDQHSIANAFCRFLSNVVNSLKRSAFVLTNFVWKYHKEIPSKSNPKFRLKPITVNETMKHLQSLKRKKSVGLDDLPSWLLKDCMEVIASPLTYIINMSFETSTFPSDWKRTKVLPLFKSGAKSSVNNYRPISVIPAISKVIEKVVHEQLTAYLESNNLINNNQFGFRPRRSTELAATIFIDTVKLKVNDGKMVGAVFLDLTKAFDMLSHGELLSKLSSFGIVGDEHEWFTDYLFGRFQQVQYKNSLSDEHPVNSGVPQGSILGPLLFIMFFNDLCTVVKHSEVVKYADDTVLFVAGKDLEIIETRLSSDMNCVLAWCLENELILKQYYLNSQTQLLKLQSLHRRATSIIGNQFLTPPDTVNMIEMRACNFIRRCLDNDVCENFKNYFTKKNHTRNTRNNRNSLKLPNLRLEYARGSFCYTGAQIYNTLPLDIRKCESYNIFKSQLREYYLRPMLITDFIMSEMAILKIFRGTKRRITNTIVLETGETFKLPHQEIGRYETRLI